LRLISYHFVAVQIYAHVEYKAHFVLEITVHGLSNT